MASSFEPKILTYKAGAEISKGMVVKHGSDAAHVIKSAAATNKHFGIAQGAAAAAEDLIEVALPGGGAKGLAGGTIALGDMLTSNASGQLVATTTTADRVIGVALASAVSGDLFEVYVILGIY